MVLPIQVFFKGRAMDVLRRFWQRLLGRTQAEADETAPEATATEPQPQEKETRPLPEWEGSTPWKITGYTPHVLVGVAQSPGRVRPNNEDAFLAWPFAMAWEDEVHWGGLFVVADGMGGHLHGEQASRAAVLTFSRMVWQETLFPWLQRPNQPPEDLLQRLESALVHAHHAVRESAPGGGTTLTAALLWDRRIFLVHVGDSRAYLLSPEGQLRLLTEDHTWARKMAESGVADEDVRQHPHRHMLYQALGQPEELDPQLSLDHRLEAGSVLLLCSDGLWEMLPDERIAQVLQAYRHQPNQAASVLVREAENAGGPDNITAVVVYQVP